MALTRSGATLNIAAWAHTPIASGLPVAASIANVQHASALTSHSEVWEFDQVTDRRTPAQLLNIGPGASQNHFEAQIARNGATAIETVTQSQIASGFDAPPYLTTNAAGTAVQFSARVDAPTTPGTSSSRSELREVDAAGVKTSWDAYTGIHELHGRTKITATPVTQQGEIIAQLFNEVYGGDRVVIRTQVFGSAPNHVVRLVARINGTGTHPGTGVIIPRLADPYVLGTEFEWKIRVEHGLVEIFYNDMSTPFYTATDWPLSHGPGSYFKAGVYNTATPATEADDTRYGTVELRDLSVSHTAAP